MASVFIASQTGRMNNNDSSSTMCSADTPHKATTAEPQTIDTTLLIKSEAMGVCSDSLVDSATDVINHIKLEVDTDAIVVQQDSTEVTIKEESIDVDHSLTVESLTLASSTMSRSVSPVSAIGLGEEEEEEEKSVGLVAPPRNLPCHRFGKGLTVQEMVRIHFDPELSKCDFSRYPVMLLEKVDKYWPVPKQAEKQDFTKLEIETVQIKEEVTDWDAAAEAEIFEANRDWSRNYRVLKQTADRHQQGLDDPSRSSFRSVTPPSDDDPDDLDYGDDDGDTDDDDFEIDMDEDDDDDYSPGSRRRPSSSDFSISPDLSEINEDFVNIGELGEDYVKAEGSGSMSDIEDENGQKKVEIVDIGGFQIETYGDYSKCPKCLKIIKSTFILRHIKLHDDPVNILKCPHKTCHTSFTRTNNMYRHMRIVHKDKLPYLCVYRGCKEKYKDSKSLRIHSSLLHRKSSRRDLDDIEAANMKYKCDFPGCGREYGKKQHLKEHFRKHTGEMRYACDVCGERFFVHGHMKRHQYSHTGIKPHACRWKCGAIFASYGGRMKHERAQHSENPYKLECDICGRPFRFDREMDKHKLTHLAPEERTAYRCSYCGILFDSIKHRVRHEQRHKDNDTFQCEDCTKMFKNEKNLRHHYKTHHENPPPGEKSKPVAKKDKREPPKYPCHMCDIKVMFALTALRRHLARKHSTNFKCDKEGCGKTFAKQYQYDTHMKLHLHRSCHLCSKDFKRKQNADIHLMGVHGLTKDDLQSLGR